MTMTVHSKTQKMVVEADGTIRVTVPISFTRKGGKKYILAPQGKPSAFEPVRLNSALVKAVAQAYRLQQEIESGKAESIRDIARRDDQSHTYLLRIYRLNLLAPDIVKAIMNGRQPKTLEVQQLLKPFPLYWPDQRSKFGFPEA